MQSFIRHSATYYNAEVYTADADNMKGTVFVVKSGKFVYVGDYEDAIKFADADVAKVDLKGRRILPCKCTTHPKNQ